MRTKITSYIRKEIENCKREAREAYCIIAGIETESEKLERISKEKAKKALYERAKKEAYFRMNCDTFTNQYGGGYSVLRGDA